MLFGAFSGAGVVAILGVALTATSAAAQLPAPAYASDPAWTATAQRSPGAGASTTMDRYGGGQTAPVQTRPQYAPQYASQYGAQPAAQAQPRVAPARLLGWSGKAEAAAQVAPQPQAPAGWTQMDRRWAAAPVQAPMQRAVQAAPPAMATRTPTYAPRPAVPRSAPVLTAAARTEPPPVESMAPPSASAWRPLYPDTQAQPVRQAASPQPTSIYDPAPAQAAYPQAAYPQAPAAPVQRVASAAQTGGPRFYSLHRDYGIQPDAIPLPPQFFGPTADLSSPPNDPIVKRTTTASGASRTVAVPAPDDTSAQ